MRSRRLLVIASFLIANSLVAQKDSIQEVEEVQVSYTVLKTITLRNTRNYLNREQINQLQPVDVGDLLKKFSGVSLKSYGGLGGLKTVSMRGLGANHTAVVVDGFGEHNTQTGQVNLGQLQVDNVLAVADIKGSDQLIDLPISTKVLGSSFFVQTFENTFSREDTLQIRASLKYGSFDRYDGYVGVKYNPNKFLVSLFGGMRQSNGEYPYRFLNGNDLLSETRTNNDYRDMHLGGTVGFNLQRFSGRIGYRYKEIAQGLPGAVILYNQTQDERLVTKDQNAFFDLSYNEDQFSSRAYVKGSQNSMRYTDPNYLNNAGGIDLSYDNRFLDAGINVQYQTKLWQFYGGVEEMISNLSVDDSSFAAPTRFHNYALLGAGYSFWKLKTKVEISTQYVAENNANGESAPDRFRANPFVSISLGEFKHHWKHQIWYKNSFRMPSFNELYYNNIGNSSLLPEDANQFNYGVSVVPIEKKFDLLLKGNVFINFVKNKIVAIPTQNLFVWSMQNIGKTRVYGMELLADIQWELGKNWCIGSSMNYSYQRTIDYTDSNSPTYRHQVAYIPLHTANFDIDVRFRNTGLRCSNYLVSKRYALNENIPQNEVDGFIITDISLYHQFNIGTKQHINVQGSVKNIFDQSYAYIRSFVMPGVNYLITLSYAFN